MSTMITPRARHRSDGSVVWQVPFRTGRRQSSETFPDAATARRFAKLIDDVGADAALETIDAWDEVDSPTWTLEAWATEHVDTLTGVQPDTRTRYHAVIRNDLDRLAELPVAAITEDAVKRWVNALADKGLSGKTIKNKHGFLSAVMEHAARRGMVTVNPCRHTRIPRTEARTMTFLTHEEFTIFLDYVTPHWQPLVEAMFSTGLRWGEITALQVTDLDLDNAALSVVRGWKDDGSIGAPKSKRSTRTIALAPETVELLRDQVAGRRGSAWVFLNQHDGPVRGGTFHENVWQPAVRLANGEPAAKGKRIARRIDAHGHIIEPATVPLGKRPRPHDARHTCASWLLGAGVPINYVQAHLGHESITTTVDRYGHVMPAARQAVSAALSAALTQARPQLEA